MSDFTLVDPKGWIYDLHSVYSAYIGYFQVYNISWYERSWGHLFCSFEEFLAFSWPVITVTDAYTGRAHIVTRLNSIRAFLKMIKTRFGETLSQAPNILQVTPFETTPRRLRNVSDYESYKKLHATLPAAVLAAQKARVRAGEPQAIREIWEKKDKTFLSLSFVWSERNEKSCLEFGYAAVRCGHIMEVAGRWPPNPDANYRKGHYIVEEYVDKVINKRSPNFPWQYAFGDSQLTSKARLPQIIQAVISSLASPDSETSSNAVVLVGHGTHGQLGKLEEMKIKIPHNILLLDTAVFERMLYAKKERGPMVDFNNEGTRTSDSVLTLENLLRSLALPQPSTPPSASLGVGASANNNDSKGSSTSSDRPLSAVPTPSNIPSLDSNPGHGLAMTGMNTPLSLLLAQCTLNNAGNDAFLSLFAFQMLLEPNGTKMPNMMKGKTMHAHGTGMGMIPGMNTTFGMGLPMSMPMAMSIQLPRQVSVPVMSINGQAISHSSPALCHMPSAILKDPDNEALGEYGVAKNKMPVNTGPGTGSSKRRSRSPSRYDLSDELARINVQSSGSLKPHARMTRAHSSTTPTSLGIPYAHLTSPGVEETARKRLSSFPGLDSAGRLRG